MVTVYGLSDKVGNLTYYDSSGQESGFMKPYSEKTAELIDSEISDIIEKQYKRAIDLLESHKDKLTQLAEVLLKKEVIFKDDLENIFGKGTFKELICLDTGSHKDEALAEYKGSDAYWIEDKLENAEAGAKVGLKSILLTHSHNENEKLTNGIQRADNWSEIVDIIVKQ